ncbi:AGAP007461-PA-like protein [Anopheles sinensis]|uniref:AGAP007461-PA-like protein n=1 Tax=Anopheles sinensis TaxID=74873 RepID=A0A084WN89_ANOSI|nr:AGAP007461-PA-like protein [Anopheles sinensis]
MSWFGEMNELKCLHLDWNQLEAVDVTVPMPFLQELSVSHNQLRTLNLTRWSFLPWLRNIHGSHNRLSSAPAGWNSMLRLQTMELSFNHIGSFNMDDLYLTQVRSLNLAANELTNVSTSMLHLRVPLEVLRMSYNRLTVLDVTRWGMPNLWELDVSHNRLTELGDVYTRFAHLTRDLFNLCQNNWSCQWFRRIHPADLKRLHYGKLLTNASCPDQKYIVTEQTWMCCSDSNQ